MTVRIAPRRRVIPADDAALVVTAVLEALQAITDRLAVYEGGSLTQHGRARVAFVRRRIEGEVMRIRSIDWGDAA